jgi:purine catabolism regulator
MAFSVQDLLDLPLLQRARPEVVVGEQLADRPVRWIHTSEIYEISPLLKGGEVLLTTGLGLVGVPGGAVRDYVRALATQGVAALMLELGRTFTRPPAELLDAAVDHGLPLVLLHGVVPFIEVTETVHPILIAGEIDHLRRLDQATGELTRALLDGRGVKDMVRTASRVCGAPAGLYSLDSDLIAGDDVPGHELDSDAAGASGYVTADVGTEPWAVLRVGAAPNAEVRRLADMCATSIGICLSQSARVNPTRQVARADLLRDIAIGRYVASSEITARANTLGFTVPAGASVVGIALDMTTLTSVRSGVDATIEAARHSFGPALVAEVDGEVLAAIVVRDPDMRARLAGFADAVDTELRATVGGGVVRLVAGPPVRDVAGLARSVPGAREAAELARKLALGTRVVLATDLGVYRLLSTVAADAELERFVEDQLGALIEQDARHASDLLQTLDAYLEAGLSKTAAATTLGVRRQTLYGRLERISRLLGGIDYADRQRRTALDLALLAWRMRTSAATNRSATR